jgi:hypothetical protein
MKDSWLQSILTQDQFKKIDHWMFELLKQSGKADPLENFEYCVVAKKLFFSLNREVLFSPNCFHKLCEAHPEFLSLDTKVIPKPELIEDNEQSFVYWFGDLTYFFKIFPPTGK